MKTDTTIFGKLTDGREVQLFAIENSKGVSINITNYGGIITRILMPGSDGVKENIVCGFSDLENYLDEEYLENHPYFGAIIGRYCNIISRGQLEIGGRSYPLEINQKPNHLNGGVYGFDKKLWEANPFKEENAAGVILTRLSPHLEENYPGNLNVTCTYTLNNNNELAIEFSATTDETTVVNLANHTYFNLTAGRDNILKHELKLHALKMVEISGEIPTGEITPTADTPFDFRAFKTLGFNIKKLPAGYNHHFILEKDTTELKHAGTLQEKSSGRRIEIFTTQPGIQVNTGKYIPELNIKGEKKFGPHSGVALVPQHYPDSVHRPNFPSTLLQPGKTYYQKTVFQFMNELY